MAVNEINVPCMSGPIPIWIDIEDKHELIVAAIKRLKEYTTTFQKPQRTILLDSYLKVLLWKLTEY